MPEQGNRDFASPAKEKSCLLLPAPPPFLSGLVSDSDVLKGNAKRKGVGGAATQGDN